MNDAIKLLERCWEEWGANTDGADDHVTQQLARDLRTFLDAPRLVDIGDTFKPGGAYFEAFRRQLNPTACAGCGIPEGLCRKLSGPCCAGCSHAAAPPSIADWVDGARVEPQPKPADGLELLRTELAAPPSPAEKLSETTPEDCFTRCPSCDTPLGDGGDCPKCNPEAWEWGKDSYAPHAEGCRCILCDRAE